MSSLIYKSMVFITQVLLVVGFVVHFDHLCFVMCSLAFSNFLQLHVLFLLLLALVWELGFLVWLHKVQFFHVLCASYQNFHDLGHDLHDASHHSDRHSIGLLHLLDLHSYCLVIKFKFSRCLLWVEKY